MFLLIGAIVFFDGLLGKGSKYMLWSNNSQKVCRRNIYDVTVRQGRFGEGLFPCSNVPQGTVLLQITGEVLLFDEVLLLGEFQSYPIQVSITEYIAPTDNTIWQFVNHSCNPNCGVNSQLQIIALEDIKCGDELFFDYSTSMLERYWTMKCECNTSLCRKIVADFDTLPIELQHKYIRLNVVQSFIIDKLNE
jgi:hypothetical protein